MKKIINSIEKKYILIKIIFINLMILNCYFSYAQVKLRAVESYFIDQTKTKVSNNIYSYSSTLPDIFEFLLKVQVTNNSLNDVYIQSANSKFILEDDTVPFIIYTPDNKLLNAMYILPKGKSYIYLYCNFKKNDIPIDVSILGNGNWLDFYKYGKHLKKTSHFFVFLNDQHTTKVENKHFNIILSRKSKNDLFNKYSLNKFETDYGNFINGIITLNDDNKNFDDFIKEERSLPIIEE